MIDQVQFKDLTHDELSDINGGALPVLFVFASGFSGLPCLCRIFEDWRNAVWHFGTA